MKQLTLLLLVALTFSSCFKEEEENAFCPSIHSYSDPDDLTLAQNGTSVRYEFRAMNYPTNYPTNLYARTYTLDGSVPAEGCIGANKGIGSISSEYTSFDITDIPVGSTVTVRVCNLFKVDSILACPSAGIVESITVH